MNEWMTYLRGLSWDWRNRELYSKYAASHQWLQRKQTVLQPWEWSTHNSCKLCSQHPAKSISHPRQGRESHNGKKSGTLIKTYHLTSWKKTHNVAQYLAFFRHFLDIFHNGWTVDPGFIFLNQPIKSLLPLSEGGIQWKPKEHALVSSIVKM